MIHTVGDSHAYHPWHNMGNCIKHIVPETLAYSVGRDGLNRVDISQYEDIKDGDLVVFSFGEIDCRCHINRFVAEDNSYENIISDVVDGYISTVKKNEEKIDKKITIAAFNIVPPPESTTPENPNYPFRGSPQQRLDYVKFFNKRLKLLCEAEGYIFIDIFKEHCNNRGFLNTTYTDGHVHVIDPLFLKDFLQKEGWLEQ